MFNDRQARAAISLLGRRINWLHEEIKLMKSEHPEGCQCRWCGKKEPDPFIVSFMEMADADKMVRGEY